MQHSRRRTLNTTKGNLGSFSKGIDGNSMATDHAVNLGGNRANAKQNLLRKEDARVSSNSKEAQSTPSALGDSDKGKSGLRSFSSG